MYEGNERIIYLDAFAGPGVYTGDEPGSPLIALETLVNHSSFSKMGGTEFLFAFIEKDKLKCQRLEQEIETFWQKQGKNKTSNIKIAVLNDEFENIAQDVLNILESDNAILAPTFAFVDPFGWSGMTLELMTKFLSFRKCEILVNFMVEDISRFLDKENTQKSLLDCFGTDRYRDFVSLSGDERIESLRDLFVDQLREKGSFKYVTPFKMVNNRGKTKYFLIHGTRSITGLRAMKDAMWKLDPTGNYQFEAKWRGRQVLFGSDIIQDLKKAIFEKFKGREVFISDIEEFVLTDTPYTIKHVRQHLKEMEDEGIISVPGRSAHLSVQATLEGMEDQKRKTYPPGTKIDFSE